jgi:ketosteroid isomerase-like protein
VIRISVIGVLVWSIFATRLGAQAATSREIDAQVWAPVSAAVARDDMDALGRLYHPAAVVVTPTGTKRIAGAIRGWRDDAMAAKAKGLKATVEFRFSRRQDDATSAFEVGMFKYTQIDANGPRPRFIPFECLLIKENGKWVMVMEHQLEAGTESGWNALPH